MAKRIFVIDDEPGICEELEIWLGGCGYEVRSARSGPEGLTAIPEFRPHLVILDIIMPVMDGFEVLAQMKRSPEMASIPVVMLTAKSETRSIMEADRLRAIDYVIKPFNPADFLKTIRRYV